MKQTADVTNKLTNVLPTIVARLSDEILNMVIKSHMKESEQGSIDIEKYSYWEMHYCLNIY